jgi:hypothetical protein
VNPYYDDGQVQIWHGDCREVSAWLEADVLVTDPPYGTGYYPTDTDAFSPAMLGEAVDRYASTAVFGWPEKLVALCVAAQVVPTEWITWWPTNAAIKAAPTRTIARESEHVAMFGVVGPVKVVRDAPFHDWKGDRQRGTSNGDPLTRFASDVWRDASPGVGLHGAHRNHPNEKPLSVMVKLATSAAPGVIADPFAGSGSTLVAAKLLGRRAIGVEVDERYCEIAARRCAQGALDFGAVS